MKRLVFFLSLRNLIFKSKLPLSSITFLISLSRNFRSFFMRLNLMRLARMKLIIRNGLRLNLKGPIVCGLPILIIISLCLVNTGCQSWPLVSRQQNRETPSSGKTPGATKDSSSDRPDDDYEYEQPANIGDAQEPQPESPWMGQGVGQGNGQVPVIPPRSLPKIPKIGVIVGPGFLRSFIAAGILGEFQKARVPVAAMVGLEWGSLPAALFAMNGQGSEVEWQMLKLHEGDLIKRGFLGGAVEMQSTGILQNALNGMFDRRTFEQGRISFECLSFDIKQKQYFWMKKGEISRAIPYCLASPPFFSPHLNNVSGTNLKLASESLRKKGMNYIIFINTLSANKDYVGSSMDPTGQTYWSLTQNQLSNIRGLVDEVIETSRVPQSLIDFEGRREMIREGQSLGAEAAERLARKLKI